jgi:hypothetical protein
MKHIDIDRNRKEQPLRQEKKCKTLDLEMFLILFHPEPKQNDWKIHEKPFMDIGQMS